ncbi:MULTISPECIES: hypothetical protein [Bacillus cereus group]|uniref:Uncharacterized protein n=1 Tax=Bacillus wiedmannii TaxID=1890302 RepID=A0A2C5DIR4_9BACI|nr:MULTISPECIES: hypothetical protein [Bacillus cereus group]MDA2261277.1 hypothetical protein [Bacillus cereus group sp. Bc200]MDA2322054.1 hypothetical protein [Bacillus cereus group sp. Bc177]MED3122375.1 hypothetical protein [Bacillus wiedmannii]OTX83190.1 hypothetical protein BK730_25375 [Bacillus wiedmannii]PEK65711.1 hypothetical protein CN595_00040 [Bacillus wiedmannii]
MQEDISLRLSSCMKCGNDDFSDIATHCKKCGTYLYNPCADPDNLCHHVNPPDAYYCELCGSETFLLLESAEQAQMDPADFVAMQLSGV